MTILYNPNHILDTSSAAMVNPVNCQGVAGAGLAKAMFEKYPDALEPYRQDCREGLMRTGRVRTYEIADPGSREQRYMIAFPTKHDWRLDSRIEWIEDGMRDLLVEVLEHRIATVAIPALGCGLGGLEWEDVQRVVEHYASLLPEVLWSVYPPRKPQP